MINNYEDFLKFLDEEVKGRNYKLLLHVCCFPCSASVLELLSKYFQITAFFANDNINDYDEFARRFLEHDKLLKSLNIDIEVIKDEYNPNLYNNAVLGLETHGERSERCYMCYKERLEQTAIYARDYNFDFFTTTLSVSPYKNANWINEIGLKLSEVYGVKFLYSNFKKGEGYKKSVALARKADLYRQEYCGCNWSLIERLQHEKSLGLALGGGGSRGSYELGVINALNSLNLKFKNITGTSIGALNAYMYAKGDFNLLNNLWENINNEQVFEEPLNFDIRNFTFANLNHYLDRILKFTGNFIKNKGAGIKPFINLLDEVVEPELLNDNAQQVGVVVTKFPSFKGEHVLLNGLGTEEIKDYLIASASCWPLFPVHKIASNKYVDGGYADNLPIAFNFELGSKIVIAVDLFKDGTHPEYFLNKDVIYILPHHDLGAFYNFGLNNQDVNMFLGFSDCYKALGLYVGYCYTFNRCNEYYELSTQIFNENKELFLSYEKKFLKIVKTKSYLGPFDYLILGLEEIARYLKIVFNEIYNLRDFITLITTKKAEIKTNSILKLYNAIVLRLKAE